jgi:hypothetical protein
VVSRTLRAQWFEAVADDVGSAQGEEPQAPAGHGSEAASAQAAAPGSGSAAAPGAGPEASPDSVPAIPDQRQEPAGPASEPVGRAEPQGRPAAEDPPADALSERERAVLSFEKQHWKYSGAKEQAIRDRFELSPTRYYQVLNSLLDRPQAQELEPVLINRLRRQRAARQRARSGRAAR